MSISGLNAERRKLAIPRYREILLLKETMSYNELARHLGLSVQRVSQLIKKAREVLNGNVAGREKGNPRAS